MNVCMLLGKNAGLIGFLTVRSMGYNIEAWYPKVKVGGVIGGHDFDQKDVHQVVLNCIGNKKILSEKKDWWYVK